MGGGRQEREVHFQVLLGSGLLTHAPFLLAQERSHPTSGNAQGWHPSCHLQPGFSFLESLDPAERVVGLSGHQLLLRPPRPETAHINSVKWKMKHDSTSEASVILTWKNGSGLNYVQRALNDFNNTLNFIIEDLALLIKASQHNYSGLYTLEVTDDTGKVKHHHFQVSVFGESLGQLSLPF